MKTAKAANHTATYLNCEQGSQEWLQARLGVPSASRFNVIVTTKGEPSKSAKAYINELVAEKITGEKTAFKVTDAMQHGTDTEDEARRFYEFAEGVEVDQVGFGIHYLGNFGCSPDGLVGNDGGLEIKCPQPKKIIEYLEKPASAITAYYQQIQGCMLVTQRNWWDLLIYHPKMKPLLQRVFVDIDFISKLEAELHSASIQIQKLHEAYKK